MWLVAPPHSLPPGFLSPLSLWVPLGAPQVTLNQTRAPTMQAAHLRHPSFCPPPAPSLSQPPPTVMNSHLPLPPWEHGFRLHSLQLLWASRPGNGGRRGSIHIPGPASTPGPFWPPSAQFLPEEAQAWGARGQGQEGELGKTLSLLACTLLPPAAAPGPPGHCADGPVGPQAPTHPPPWYWREASWWVCGETPVFPRGVIPASGGTVLWCGD